jgi:hypothetical protein
MTKLEKELQKIKEKQQMDLKACIMKANPIGRKAEKLGKMPL